MTSLYVKVKDSTGLPYVMGLALFTVWKRGGR